MHARKVINIIGLFSTHQYKQTFKEKTVQQPSERDTVTGCIKIYFEEYRVYVSCVSEISKAHFCINLHLSAVCMHVVQTTYQTNCSIDGYKYTLNNVSLIVFLNYKSLWIKASDKLININVRL